MDLLRPTSFSFTRCRPLLERREGPGDRSKRGGYGNDPPENEPLKKGQKSHENHPVRSPDHGSVASTAWAK
jgi:hypothetical protein